MNESDTLSKHVNVLENRDTNVGNKSYFLCSLQISPFIPFSNVFITMH